MARKGRKVSPQLVTDSQALARSIADQLRVLAAWYPKHPAIYVCEAQIQAFQVELQGMAVDELAKADQQAHAETQR